MEGESVTQPTCIRVSVVGQCGMTMCLAPHSGLLACLLVTEPACIQVGVAVSVLGPTWLACLLAARFQCPSCGGLEVCRPE